MAFHSTNEHIDDERRRLCCSAAALAASGLGLLGASTGPAPAAAAPRSSTENYPPLRRVAAGSLDIAYAQMGPEAGRPIILLHGWPYDIHSFAEAAPILAADGFRVIVPYLRGHGATQFVAAEVPRNGQPAALAQDLIDLMNALQIERAILAGFDWGARTAAIVAALWPQRVTGLVSVSGYLIGSQAAGGQPLPPEAELQWWYQFYFATERGRLGYEENRHAFAQLIWKLGSPQWSFDDATFARSAAALDNADHVAIVVHNYRWRLGLAEGERRFDAVEQRLAMAPGIAVPSITLEGDSNGAPHPLPSSYAAKFSGPYEHRTIKGGIGHNLPQEAPHDFAKAVIDVARRRAA